MAEYVPDSRDIVWLTFDPQAGKEKAGRRPELVMSPRSYNGRAGLALVCPLTRQVKGYPFEVPVEFGGVSGAILADHIRSADWRTRRAVRIGKCPEGIVEEVVAKIAPLLAV